MDDTIITIVITFFICICLALTLWTFLHKEECENFHEEEVIVNQMSCTQLWIHINCNQIPIKQKVKICD